MFRLTPAVFGSRPPVARGKRSGARGIGPGLRFASSGLPSFPHLLMVAVAGALIVVSASFSVRFAQSVGAPSGNAWIFILMALAVEGFAAFAIPAFWRGLSFLGRAGLLAFLMLCLVYKITAADHFAFENYGAREASQSGQAASFERAKQRVTDLRQVLEDNAAARAPGVVAADIRAAQQHARWASTAGCTNATVDPSREFCEGFYRLEGELAMAQKAADAEAQLAVAIGKLDGMDPVAATAAQGGGMIPDLLEWAGIAVGGFTVFISKLCMLIVEGGSVAVPAMAGLVRRTRIEPDVAAPEPSPAQASPAQAASPPEIASTTRALTLRERAAIEELTRFLESRTARQAGDTVQSSRLYAAYVGWKEGQKGKPMPIQMFGTVLTHHLGLTKTKIDGRHHYHNLRVTSAEKPNKTSPDLHVETSGAK